MGPHKKHKRRSSPSDSRSDGSRKRKEKKRLKKHSTDSEEERRKERKRLKKEKKSTKEASADIPLELMEKSKAMAPMTKDEWEKRQSVVRRVYDESTGRHRLIKGDGEVIEEIVSRDRHKAINQQATKGDGAYFQTQISKNIV